MHVSIHVLIQSAYAANDRVASDVSGPVIEAHASPRAEVIVGIQLEVSGLGLPDQTRARLADGWLRAAASEVAALAGQVGGGCAEECRLWLRADPARMEDTMRAFRDGLNRPARSRSEAVPDAFEPWLSPLGAVRPRSAREVLRAARATVVGLGPTGLQAGLEATFGDLRGETGAVPRRSNLVSRRLLKAGGAGVARVAVRWSVPTRGEPERAAWDRVAALVAGGPASRLYRRLREREGLTYTIEEEPGLDSYTVRWVSPPDGVGVAVRCAEEELARLMREGPTAFELAGVEASLVAEQARRPELTLLDRMDERVWGLPRGALDPRPVSREEVLGATRWLAGPKVWIVEGDPAEIRGLEAEGFEW